MPRRKAVKPLQKLCLENVAANMQLLWAKDYTDHYLDEYNFRYIQGPFSELAGSLVQELMGLMGTTRRLTRPMLHLLVVPQLTELNFSRCSKLVTKTITQIITSRCKNLSSLYLQGCSRVPSDALVDLIESLPCIKKLDLSETQCDTRVLSAVGSTCQQLCELDISDCKRLSPDSLFHLAYDITSRSCCCQGLQILSVDGLEPRAGSQDLVWALAFLLLALPSLRFLENEFVDEAVCRIHSQRFSRAPIAPGFPPLEELARGRMAKGSSRLTLPLKELLEVDESSLPLVCTVCPHLTKASVFLGEDSGLSPSFSSWRALTDLTLDCSDHRKLNELLPVAALIGAQLHSLSVDGFILEDELSFHMLLSRCPNLQKFSASIFLSLRPQKKKSAAPDAAFTPLQFSDLGDFRLILSTLSSEPSPATAGLRASLMSVLKNAPVLESLDLFSLPFGLDEVFKKVLEPPGPALMHLRFLSLVECKVASSTIHLLLSADNPLESIHLDKCPAIHRRAYDELLRRVSREGFELQIEWQ